MIAYALTRPGDLHSCQLSIQVSSILVEWAVAGLGSAGQQSLVAGSHAGFAGVPLQAMNKPNDRFVIPSVRRGISSLIRHGGGDGIWDRQPRG